MRRITLKEIFKKYYIDYERQNSVPKDIVNAMDKILKCKTEYLGGMLYMCPECGELKEVYNSCRHRACPFCRERLNKKWYNKQIKRLPNLNYDHIVFTVPHELNEIYLLHKEDFTKFLFDSVNKAIQERLKKMKLKSGYILQLHTNGGNQNLHIHIHCLILRGGVSEEGRYISKDKFFINIDYLINGYRENLMKALRKLTKNDKKLNEVSKRNWNVKLTDDFDGKGESVLKYLSKSKSGGSITDDRIKGIKEGTIYFTDKSKKKIFKLRGKEFVRRYLLHIPSKSQHLTRSYGLFYSAKDKDLKRLLLKYGPITDKEEDILVEVKCRNCHVNMNADKEILKLEDPRLMEQLQLYSGRKIC